MRNLTVWTFRQKTHVRQNYYGNVDPKLLQAAPAAISHLDHFRDSVGNNNIERLSSTVVPLCSVPLA